MLGHYGIPMEVSFISHMEMRQFNTDLDGRRWMEILQCCEFCTYLAMIRTLKPSDKHEKTKHICWLTMKFLSEISLTHEKLKKDGGDFVLDVLRKFGPPLTGIDSGRSAVKAIDFL